MNGIFLEGRLCAAPELKKTASGKSVVSCAVAVEGNRDSEAVMFLRCTWWEKRAEFIARNGKKGMRLTLSGELKINKWTDKDGCNRESPFVLVENTALVYPPKESGTAFDQNGPADVNVSEFDEVPLDDSCGLPF